MSVPLWSQCLRKLEGELTEQQLNTWVRPLQANEINGGLQLLAPNRFVLDWVHQHFLPKIISNVQQLAGSENYQVLLEIGSQKGRTTSESAANRRDDQQDLSRDVETASSVEHKLEHNLNSSFTFESFVEGKSNQLARAAAIQVAENPGKAYNPLFLYGGVGLGKTHILHAVGNRMLQNNPNARILYLHSERFVGDMINAFQHNTIISPTKRSEFFICIQSVSWAI